MHSKDRRGICLISVPKSGTMFLSRYLEKIADIPSTFGLAFQTPSELSHELRGGWHPAIRAALRRGSPELDAMARRFSLFLARHRKSAHSAPDPVALVSDHGFHSFLRFLIDPKVDDIVAPEQIIDWAEQRNLVLVYLYRDIRAIANSLAHFLSGGKSFLLSIDTLPQATQLVSDLYAPVLAEQMHRWAPFAGDPRVMTVQYEELIKSPAVWIGEICRRGNIPFRAEDVIQSADQYPSWTYRRAQGASWRTTFSPEQQAKLGTL